MVAYIDDFIALLLGLLCAVPILPTHASNYFMDKGECKCVPYSKDCSMEVIDISMQSSFYAKTMTCWYGTRLCCDKSSPSRARNGNRMEYLRGYVFRINSLLDKHNRHHASMDSRTKDEYGNSKQMVKINKIDRGQQNPKNLGIITTIPNAAPLTTESTKEIEKAEEIKQHRPNLLHRPTDVKYTSKTVLNIPGERRKNLEDSTKSFSTGNKIIENISADEDGKLIISIKKNKGNRSDENGTEKVSASVSESVKTESQIKTVDNGGKSDIPFSDKNIPNVLPTTLDGVTESKVKVNISGYKHATTKCTEKERNCTVGLTNLEKQNSTTVYQVVPSKLENKHSYRTASAIPKDNRSLLITLTTDPSKMEGKVLTLEVPTAVSSYVKGTNLVIETANINEGALFSKVSETSSVAVLSNSSSVSYSIATKAFPVLSLNGDGERNRTKQVVATIFQSQLTSYSVVTLSAPELSKVPQMSATKHLHLTVSYTSVTVKKVPSAVVVPEVHNSSVFLIPAQSHRSSAHLDSRTTMSSEISNSYISVRTAVSPVFTLTKGSSYVKISKTLHVKTPLTTVVSLASKSSSRIFSYTLNLTPTVNLETPLITTKSHVFTKASEVFIHTQNLTHPLSLKIMTTAVSLAFITASEIFSLTQNLTPPLSTKTSSSTALFLASPLVSDVFSYTKNMTSHVNLEIPLITLVSPEFTLTSKINLYSQNLTSLVTLRTTQLTAASTVFTMASELFSHTQNSTRPASLKSAFVTAVSPVFRIASRALLKQTVGLGSRLFAANSPAFTIASEVFSYTQNLTLPANLNTPLITAPLTLLKVSARGTNTQTRSLIPNKMETVSFQVFPDLVFPYQTEDTSNVVSPNRENHKHSNIAYERLSSLFTTSVKLIKSSHYYEELSFGSKSKTSTTHKLADVSPPDLVSRAATNSVYLTPILEYYTSRNAFSSVLHTSAVLHSSAEKYSGYTNINKKLVTHLKHYIRATKVLKSYVQKYSQSTIFKSQPSSSVNGEGLYTNTLSYHLTLSVKPALFQKVTETGKYTFKSTTKIPTHKIYESNTIALVGAKYRDLNPSKSLAIDFVPTLKIQKLKASKSRNLVNKGKATEKSNNQEPPSIYIKPSSALEKKFQNFLKSMLEERLNKSKTETDEGSGVWGWFFG